MSPPSITLIRKICRKRAAANQKNNEDGEPHRNGIRESFSAYIEIVVNEIEYFLTLRIRVGKRVAGLRKCQCVLLLGPRNGWVDDGGVMR
jgi:hypothetical protein